MKIAERSTTRAAAAAVAAFLLAACGGEQSDYWEETSYRDAAAASACAPKLQSGEVAALYVYNCDGKWRIRATAGGKRASHAGVITSDRPMKVQAYRLERHDLLEEVTRA
jgi:hypothetical protein